MELRKRSLSFWISVLTMHIFEKGSVKSQDCPSNDLIVYTDDTCITMHLIPPHTTTYGSNVTYRCSSRLQQLPVSTLDFCPVELCKSPGNWTQGYLSCGQNECYNNSTSHLYQGRRNCGASGTLCQAWAMQSPNTHSYVSTDFYEGDINKANNYCRDPNGVKGKPWCFSSSTIGWEYCEVQMCADLPIDAGICTTTTSTMTTTTMPTSTLPIETTIAGECNFPDAVPFATFYNDGTQIGSVVDYTCFNGYFHTSGNLTRTCINGGIWNGILPVCTVVTCQEPPEVSNATKTVSGYNVGHSVSYTCHDGYGLEAGNLVRTCTIEGTWDSISPVCTNIAGGQLTHRKYIKVQNDLQKYKSIKVIQNIPTNLSCANKCNKLSQCNFYTFGKTTKACKLFSFDMTGSSVDCTGNEVCFDRQS